jgi:hypothetical protein
MKDLVISFSGGETSAFMAQWCKNNIAKDYARVITIFANTGQENEETLEFVDRCDKEFGLGVVWLEADVIHGERIGTGYKIVSFKTADRVGDVFESVIRKYGIPNKAYPHCTRELKLAPIYSYLKSIGLVKGSYEIAIGIRHDEIDRMSASADANGIIYPLISSKMQPATKPMINQWWANQPFRLELKGYQGNCKWCWKKSLRKHITLINENQDQYAFPQKMEELYGLAGTNRDGYKRVFFRDHMSTIQLLNLSKTSNIAPAEDDSAVYPEKDLFGLSLDESNGCSESCEIDF